MRFLTHHYPYSPPDRLYTDHLGRRIVADWEGDGELEAEVKGGQAWLESEDGLQPLASGHAKFRGYGLVIADESARTTIEIGADFEEFEEGLCGLTAFSIDDGDALKMVDWKVQNMSERTMLASKNELGEPWEHACASHLNAAHFTTPCKGNWLQGLVINKFFDRFHGRQRARVLVDGEVVGMWYEPREDRECRWGEGYFRIPLSFIQGKEKVTITIDPPSGTPLWSVGRIEVLGITPRVDRAKK